MNNDKCGILVWQYMFYQCILLWQLRIYMVYGFAFINQHMNQCEKHFQAVHLSFIAHVVSLQEKVFEQWKNKRPMGHISHKSKVPHDIKKLELIHELCNINLQQIQK